MKIKLRYITATLVCCSSSSTTAQDIELLQALHLGTIAVIDNSTVSTVKITKEGLARATGGIHFIQTGQPAIFEATNFDPNRRLYINVTVLQSGTVTTMVSPEQFSIQEYDHLEFIQTDNQGTAQFLVGATFATSGSSSEGFRDTQYNANYSVTINY